MHAVLHALACLEVFCALQASRKCLAEEECAKLMAVSLVKGAVAEDAALDMEDDVLSLIDSEDEGEMVQLACEVASAASASVLQGIQLDFGKAVEAAAMENEAYFSEVIGFNETEMPRASVDKVELLRQEAREALAKAVGDGRLAAAFKQRQEPEEKKMVSSGDDVKGRPMIPKMPSWAKAMTPSLTPMQRISSAPTLHKSRPDMLAVNKLASPIASQALKLAWYMAGSPSKSLRQKERPQKHSGPAQSSFDLPRCSSLGSLKTRALPPLPMSCNRPWQLRAGDMYVIIQYLQGRSV